MTDNIALIGASTSRRADELMWWAIDDAIAHLKRGDREQALQRMVGSVFGEQARVAGIRVEESP